MPKLFQVSKNCRVSLGVLSIVGIVIFAGCDTELNKPPTIIDPACTTNDECSGGTICELGECVSDPCKDIVCDAVPAVSCNGNQAVSYDASGECRGGDCFYAPKMNDCGDEICEEGICQADPCKDVACSTPPSATCNGNIAVTYSLEGTCSEGECSYQSSEVVCGTGEQCVNANCELYCNCTSLQTCNETTGDCIEPALCLSDGDCNGARVCVQGACTDEIPECRANDDCTDGICITDLLECEANVCTQEDDCSSMSHCKVATGQCVQCLDASHCSGDQTCESNVCEAPGICTANEDCVSPQICGKACDNPTDDFATCLTAQDCPNGACVAACVDVTCTQDDAFDTAASNNFHATASALTFTDSASGPHAIKICGMDDDEWFEIDATDLQENDGLVISASFPAGTGRVELFVMTGDEFSEEIDRDEGSTGNLVISIDNVPAPSFYLRFHATEGTSIEIDFDVEVFPGGLCGGDTAEPNNNSSGATAIGNNPVAEGRGYLLCEDSIDEDWFSFSADAGKSIEVRLSADTTAVAGIELYSSQNSVTTLISKDVSSNANKLLTHISTGGTHYVRIYSTDAVHGKMAGAMSVTTAD